MRRSAVARSSHESRPIPLRVFSALSPFYGVRLGDHLGHRLRGTSAFADMEIWPKIRCRALDYPTRAIGSRGVTSSNRVRRLSFRPIGQESLGLPHEVFVGGGINGKEPQSGCNV